MPAPVSSSPLLNSFFASSLSKSSPSPDAFYNCACVGDSAKQILKKWVGQYNGLPPFGPQINSAVVKEALNEGIRLKRSQLDKLLNETVPSPQVATFENTVEEMENIGRPFIRALAIYHTYTSSMKDKSFQALESEMEPVLSAVEDELIQNEELFQRIKKVYDDHFGEGKNENNSVLTLTSEQKRLLETKYKYFVDHGATLTPEKKKELAAVNQDLSRLYTVFAQNVLYDEEEQYVLFNNVSDLDGLPKNFIDAAQAAAEARGKKEGNNNNNNNNNNNSASFTGKYLISNTRSSVAPLLTLATHRATREKVFHMFVSRGSHEGEHDNRPIIRDILLAREKKANLLGYKTFSQWILSKNMAKAPQAAKDLITKVGKYAAQAVERDLKLMLPIAVAEDPCIKDKASFQPWDYRYYAEKLRKQLHDFDDAEVTPYLGLENMIQGCFWAAQHAFGIRMKRVPELKGWHEDTRVYQVLKNDNDDLVGILYYDPYARPGKSSGAWMSDLRAQENFPKAKDDGPKVTTPIVTNNLNFIRASNDGPPTLISWDDATTLFHEFGHAIHALVSNVTYASLAGTNVLADFVEMPSQLFEHWLPTQEVLSRFAKHYETGEVIPQSLVDKIFRAQSFNQGFATVEYLLCALFDITVHDSPTNPFFNVDDAEQETIFNLGASSSIAFRHRPTQFNHAFSSEGYASQYYSYLWADVLTADAAEAFEEVGNFYDPVTTKRLLDTLLTKGNTVDPAEAYRQFRGRGAQVEALLRTRGFLRPGGGCG